ncbi:Pimeloyl-ACP methyl ester carboxylesterase [Collimonas sp. OK307]|uniref:alpha/beta fold hydrolase n=1 Tax=Collimonas sp. OK307 TaxID=1801620 RepID=UPI0008E5720B|nr:alpha/beta hydrolase [Collimonas sp. OK307]SFH61622.1 Pimeloyl-ACP methyl ester carboxylesterase [Collimonas sp. OK307]
MRYLLKRHLLKASVLALTLATPFISQAAGASNGSPDSNLAVVGASNDSLDSAKISKPPIEQALEVNWKTVPTQFISAGGVEFAYRELGKQNGGTPVVFLGHLAAVLDNWDPRVVDGIAAKHHVVVFDNRGVGASSGASPKTIEQMADDATTFIKAMGFNQVDLFGFSMGGMISQEIVLKDPQLVRKMILAGTGPAGGKGISDVSGVSNFELLHGLITFQDPKQYLFFTRTPNGIAAGKAFLARLKERTENRDKEITFSAYFAQLQALKAWGQKEPADLSVVKNPVLIVNGDNDRMVPTTNTHDLARRLPNSTLVIYPDAGHGGVFQFHEEFVLAALEFLAR